MTSRIHFNGNFFEYFVYSLGLFALSVITLGLALPYYGYWSLKYFFTKLRVNGGTIRFNGNFGDYFLKALGLLVLSVLTLGLVLPYFSYWSFKYFFSHLELDLPNQGMQASAAVTAEATPTPAAILDEVPPKAEEPQYQFGSPR